MIVINNFVHAHSLFLQGHIPLRVLQDQAKILLDIFPQPNRYVEEAQDISQSDIEWLLRFEEASEPYNGMLGGEFYVCQTEADLKKIEGMDMEFARTHGNRWPNVTDMVMSWDGCKYLDQKDTDPEWAMFLLCWNDAGGPVYYVPKHLWSAGKVPEHVAETDQHWNGD